MCSGIAHVSGNLVKPLSRALAERGRYTMYLPLSPQGICRAKRADTLCIYRTPCPERGALPADTCPEPQNSQSDFFFCRTLSGRLFFLHFILMNACSPGTKTGTRAHSPKPSFYETALLSPGDSFFPSQGDSQGESNMHRIVVTVLCRLRPTFPEGEFAPFRYRKTPCFSGKSYYCNMPSGLYSGQRPQGRKYEKITKKITKSPTLGWAPKIRKKLPKKYKNGHFRAILVVFRYFSYFFRISGLGGFLCPARARRNRNPTISTESPA